MKLKIEEAIAMARVNGQKIMKTDIAARIWPNNVLSAQRVNMTRLCTGETASVKPEWINIICDMTGCTADFLLGRTNQ